MKNIFKNWLKPKQPETVIDVLDSFSNKQLAVLHYILKDDSWTDILKDYLKSKVKEDNQ